MRYEYRNHDYYIFQNDLSKANEILKQEFEKNKLKIKKHQNKFYWKPYAYINEKRFKRIRTYCKDIIEANNIIVSLINAYKIMDQNNIDPIFLFWEHKSFITSINYQFKGLRNYEKFHKKHPYKKDYNESYEKLRYEMQKILYRLRHKKDEPKRNKSSKNRQDIIPNNIKQSLNILGISSGNIDFNIIRKSYKQAAKKHHPDKGGSINQMQRINQAYDTLKKYYQLQEA